MAQRHGFVVGVLDDSVLLESLFKACLRMGILPLITECSAQVSQQIGMENTSSVIFRLQLKQRLEQHKRLAEPPLGNFQLLRILQAPAQFC